MSETNDWARRVDEMTAATRAEQLRSVVQDAEEMLQKFTTAAYEQGGLILDAQHEMKVSVERKIEQMIASMDEMAARLAAMEARMVDVSASASAEMRTLPTIAAVS